MPTKPTKIEKQAKAAMMSLKLASGLLFRIRMMVAEQESYSPPALEHSAVELMQELHLLTRTSLDQIVLTCKMRREHGKRKEA